MKTRYIITIIVAIAFISNISMADDKQKRADKTTWIQQDANAVVNLAPINYATEPSIFTITFDPGFQTDSYLIGPEIPTENTGFYDYKTNGEANHYIQVDPADPMFIHAIDTQADSLEPGGATTRRTFYSVSTDGGASWTQLAQVPEIRSGFGVLKLKDGAAMIANHNAATGVINSNLYQDIAPGGGAFNQFLATSPASIWPQMEVLSNGNAIVISRPQTFVAPYDSLYAEIWNGTALGSKTLVFLAGPNFQSTIGSNMQYNVAQNNQGRVTIGINPVLEDDTLGGCKVYQRTSTDNGVTWGGLEVIFSPFTENGGEDTIAVAGGCDMVYKPNTSTWVYSLSATADGTFANTRIYIFKSDGTRSTMVTAAEVGATTTYSKAMAFVASVDQPSLGYSADGSVLYCVYAVVKPDTGSSGFNSRDIYYQRSLDDGSTWGAPIQVTNTPTIDECYPSVSNWNVGTTAATYDLNFTYMKDPGVGPTSFNGSSPTAPASRNYQVYRKISQASTVGISNNHIDLNDYSLMQNYPNPFNPSTTISYNLVKSGFVSLKIYNVLGKEVKTLVSEVQQPGVKEINFDASGLTSGIYFYRIDAGDFSAIKKMMLVK